MCRYNAAVCAPFVGQPVMVRTRGGVYRGRVDRVTDGGLYFSPFAARTVEGEVSNEFWTLEQTGQVQDVEHVQWGWGWGYGFGAPFFIPFFSILALSTLFWW